MKKKNNEPKAVVVAADQEEFKDYLVLSKSAKEVPYNETIETERSNIFKVYKSTTKLNSLLMVIAVAAFIASFILVSRAEAALKITGWVLVGVTMVGLIVYYLLTRNLYPNTSKKYFRVFWKESNEYLFDDPKFSDCKIDVNERYQLADVLADRVYKDVIDLASRNLVRGKFDNKPFTFGELAFYKAGAKKHSKEVIFVGRHLTVENDYHFEGRYIVNIKGEKGLDLPNDVDDLVVLKEEENLVIYGPEGSKVEKDLPKRVLIDLTSLNCRGSLLNICVVFWAGRTAAYLSYDDAIVAIPFESPLNVEAYASLKNNIKDMLEILEK